MKTQIINSVGKIRYLALLLVLTITSTQVWGDEASLTSVSSQKTVSTTDASVSLTFGDVTCTVTKKSTNSPGFYTSKGIVRYYNKDIMTISVSSGKISKIVFVMNSGNVGTVSVGSLSGDKKTWTGSESSVSFTGGGTVKITSITVTYTASSCATNLTIKKTENNGTFNLSNISQLQIFKPHIWLLYKMLHLCSLGFSASVLRQ